MHSKWLDDDGRFLSPACPLPLDLPFTRAEAISLGVSRRRFQRLLDAGLVRQVLTGVYAASQCPDDMHTRASAVACVVPEHEVVCGTTAAWLHGVAVLPRSATYAPPPVEVVSRLDTRVRRPETDGRRRQLAARDIGVVAGVRTTTPLRTALDLGRLLWRYDALAALDGYLRLGVTRRSMLNEVGRFRGFRGVRQLRMLLPLADPRAQSPPESALRLRWYEAELPAPAPQYRVEVDPWSWFDLDIGEPECRFAAEYDGEEFHTREEDTRHDEERRRWLREERGWTIEVFTKRDLYGIDADPTERLLTGYASARRTSQLWTPQFRVG